MKEGDKVDIIIGNKTPLGYNVLINTEVEGLIYNNEVFETLTEGSKTIGYIKKLREDGKIDVSLNPIGFKNAIAESTKKVLLKLAENKGVLNLNDKSSPDEIKEILQISKKNFKKAIGVLYKQKQIIITDTQIVLNTKRV